MLSLPAPSNHFCDGCRAEKVLLFIKRTLGVSTLFRLLLEGYLEIFLSCQINMFDMRYETASDVYSSIMTILSMGLSLVFPLFILRYVVFTSPKVLATPSYQKNYGTLYEELKMEKGALLYWFFFLVRRGLFSLMAIFGGEYPSLQVQSMLLTQILLSLYLGYFKPFELPFFNMIEMVNETSITLVTYHLFLFTDFLEDRNIQYFIGFSIIGITVLNVLFNTSLMFYQAIYTLRLVLKKCRYRMKKKKNVAPDMNTSLWQLNSLQTLHYPPGSMDVTEI
mmetsp:Transcript_20624/g.19609  ORF Transcript_20624/g.19609 Transcript_20624/m.19609 type:complete len:279 (+) Transcript_20624:1-837(+)